MSWQKSDDQAGESKKIRRAKLDVIGFWWLAGNYCCRQENDGFIPKEELADVFRPLGHRVNHARIASKCVAAGLLIEHSDHFEVHDFLEFNTSREEAERKRDADAKRQMAKRARDRAAALLGILPTVTRDIQCDSRSDTAPTPTVTPFRSVTESVPPGPARPDPGPTRPVPSERAHEFPVMTREPDPIGFDPVRSRERDAAQRALGVAYAKRYEVQAGAPWMAYGPNEREIASVAGWALSHAEKTGASVAEVAETLMAGVFADPWMSDAKRRWPWKAIAKDPARYLAGAAELDRDKRVREVKALEAARRDAYARGDYAAVEAINAKILGPRAMGGTT